MSNSNAYYFYPQQGGYVPYYQGVEGPLAGGPLPQGRTAMPPGGVPQGHQGPGGAAGPGGPAGLHAGYGAHGTHIAHGTYTNGAAPGGAGGPLLAPGPAPIAPQQPQQAQQALRRGPWAPSEDKRLLEIVAMFGGEKSLNWVKISQMLETRTAKQARERYHQNLKPTLNRAPISEEEGRLIETLVAKHGKRWAEIARHLNGRSDNAIKNWWNGGANRRRRSVSGPKVEEEEDTEEKADAETEASDETPTPATAPLHGSQGSRPGSGSENSNGDNGSENGNGNGQSVKGSGDGNGTSAASAAPQAPPNSYMPPPHIPPHMIPYAEYPQGAQGAQGVQGVQGVPSGAKRNRDPLADAAPKRRHSAASIPAVPVVSPRQMGSPPLLTPLLPKTSRTSSIGSFDMSLASTSNSGSMAGSRRGSLWASNNPIRRGSLGFVTLNNRRDSSVGMSNVTSLNQYSIANTGGSRRGSLMDPQAASQGASQGFVLGGPLIPPLSGNLSKSAAGLAGPGGASSSLFKKEFSFDRAPSLAPAPPPGPAAPVASKTSTEEKQKMSISSLVS